MILRPDPLTLPPVEDWWDRHGDIVGFLFMALQVPVLALILWLGSK